MKKRFQKVLLISVSLIVIWVFLFRGTVSRDMGYHCDFTGSMKTWTSWPFFYRTDFEYEESPLETFVRENYPDELEHKWAMYSAVGKNIYRDPTIFACGRKSDFLYLDRGILRLFVEQSSSEEVMDFYNLLRRDDRDEVQLRVQELWEDGERLWRTVAEQAGAAKPYPQ